MHDPYRHTGCFKYFLPSYWRYRAKMEVLGCVSALIFLPLFFCLVVGPIAARSYDSSLSIWYLIVPIGLFALILFVGLPLLVFLIHWLRNR